MKHTDIILMLILAATTAGAQQRSLVWNPDRGDGTYVNPVINADYSDPDVCAVGDDYYLTASSFNCIPDCPYSTPTTWSTGASPVMRCRNNCPARSSPPCSTAKACGHPPYAITRAASISTGVIPTEAS